MKIKPVHIFLVLCLLFIMYSFSIYLNPCQGSSPKTENVNSLVRGKLVWQKYNCQSCHQLYGLGGYLGPDLSNIYSAKDKGPIYIKAFIKSGTKQMPSFGLNTDEENDLLEFLKSADASGKADPREFQTHATGMTEQK